MAQEKMGFVKKLKKFSRDFFPMLIGELVVAALVCLGFFAIDLLDLVEGFDFSSKVIFGSILGASVIILNYLFLIISVDREVNRFVEKRGKAEMTGEEAEKFTKENSAPIQAAFKLSFIFRTFSIMAALIIAFVSKLFNPIATAIPMFAFRPLLTVVNMVMSKFDKKPDPAKFVKYDFDEENENEKEED